MNRISNISENACVTNRVHPAQTDPLKSEKYLNMKNKYKIKQIIIHNQDITYAVSGFHGTILCENTISRRVLH